MVLRSTELHKETFLIFWLHRKWQMYNYIQTYLDDERKSLKVLSLGAFSLLEVWALVHVFHTLYLTSLVLVTHCKLGSAPKTLVWHMFQFGRQTPSLCSRVKLKTFLFDKAYRSRWFRSVLDLGRAALGSVCRGTHGALLPLYHRNPSRINVVGCRLWWWTIDHDGGTRIKEHDSRSWIVMVDPDCVAGLWSWWWIVHCVGSWSWTLITRRSGQTPSLSEALFTPVILVLSYLKSLKVQNKPSSCGSALGFGWIKIRLTWTSMSGSPISLGGHFPSLSHTRACTCMQKTLPCLHDKGRIASFCLLFTHLSRTQTFIRADQRCVSHFPPIQYATELWSPSWCSLKGGRTRERCSGRLTLSQWLQTLPIHHCWPRATSFLLPLH